MTDDLIAKAAELMAEQVRDYAKLDAACHRLSGALIHGDAALIESMTRDGEGELMQMRARLVRIIQALTAFADARAANSTSDSLAAATPLTAEVRAKFEAASNDLLSAANQ